MTQPTPAGPHAVIAAALEDWWLTTDPAEPFNTAAVAEDVERYLNSSGYRITPDTGTERMTDHSPGRGTLAGTALITLGGLASTAAAAIQGGWGWA